MTDDEYKESKEDTEEQLVDFNERLSKITTGDITLLDKLSIINLVSITFIDYYSFKYFAIINKLKILYVCFIQATTAAIAKAFQTPYIIKMFAKNEPNALKDKRNQIERDMKLGKLNLEIGNRQKVSIN